MADARTPPPGMTRKQWRRLQNEIDTAKPPLKTATGILANEGGHAVNRQTLGHVLGSTKGKR
jgi:hypothetical protein